MTQPTARVPRPRTRPAGSEATQATVERIRKLRSQISSKRRALPKGI